MAQQLDYMGGGNRPHPYHRCRCDIKTVEGTQHCKTDGGAVWRACHTLWTIMNWKGCYKGFRFITIHLQVNFDMSHCWSQHNHRDSVHVQCVTDQSSEYSDYQL